jgi:hypothetical protein
MSTRLEELEVIELTNRFLPLIPISWRCLASVDTSGNDRMRSGCLLYDVYSCPVHHPLPIVSQNPKHRTATASYLLMIQAECVEFGVLAPVGWFSAVLSSGVLLNLVVVELPDCSVFLCPNLPALASCLRRSTPPPPDVYELFLLWLQPLIE